ncbi:hypothetical protein AYI68_g1938 [Smittium mucronatum]|uniref:Uncharacterized protein n=1 Tax=Smittium mucronatum TaxID=133383 RepID=A0A1R0H492_9FUNG|nr:hypothetical protein AYI68_g1938 [Smittium mucronatum]
MSEDINHISPLGTKRLDLIGDSSSDLGAGTSIHEESRGLAGLDSGVDPNLVIIDVDTDGASVDYESENQIQITPLKKELIKSYIKRDCNTKETLNKDYFEIKANSNKRPSESREKYLWSESKDSKKVSVSGTKKIVSAFPSKKHSYKVSGFDETPTKQSNSSPAIHKRSYGFTNNDAESDKSNNSPGNSVESSRSTKFQDLKRYDGQVNDSVDLQGKSINSNISKGDTSQLYVYSDELDLSQETHEQRNSDHKTIIKLQNPSSEFWSIDF